MSENPSAPKKDKQFSLEEYKKIKEKLAKSKLKLSFPWVIKFYIILPIVYIVFLIIFYLVYLRFNALK